LHVITGTNVGGAERVLSRLIARTQSRGIGYQVISLVSRGPVADDIEREGVRVVDLAVSRNYPSPFCLWRVAQIIRRFKPDAIHTWMYHANLIGGLAAALVRQAPVIWGIHHTTLLGRQSKRRTICVDRACAALSGFVPYKIVYCAREARRVHEARGYDPVKGQVIVNGVDTSVFRPDPTARLALRRELAVAADCAIVGLASRYDPQKDHPNFIDAASIVARRVKNVHFVLCGDGVDSNNHQLTSAIRRANLVRRVHLLGRVAAMPRLLAAWDVACSSSYGEALPVAILEAMSCGVPCVVTAVGDLGEVVGGAGLVVPPHRPRALAEGVEELLLADPNRLRQLSDSSRHRVEDRYSLSQMTDAYLALYAQAAGSAFSSRTSRGTSGWRFSRS